MTGNGERKDGREIIARSTERLIKAGLSTQQAQKRAREARVRNEKRGEKQ